MVQGKVCGFLQLPAPRHRWYESATLFIFEKTTMQTPWPCPAACGVVRSERLEIPRYSIWDANVAVGLRRPTFGLTHSVSTTRYRICNVKVEREEIQEHIEDICRARLQSSSSACTCDSLNCLKFRSIVLFALHLLPHNRTVRMGWTMAVYIQRIFLGRNPIQGTLARQAFLILSSIFSRQFNLGSRVTPRYYTLEERTNLC